MIKKKSGKIFLGLIFLFVALTITFTTISIVRPADCDPYEDYSSNTDVILQVKVSSEKDPVFPGYQSKITGKIKNNTDITYYNVTITLRLALNGSETTENVQIQISSLAAGEEVLIEKVVGGDVNYHIINKFSATSTGSSNGSPIGAVFFPVDQPSKSTGVFEILSMVSSIALIALSVFSIIFFNQERWAKMAKERKAKKLEQREQKIWFPPNRAIEPTSSDAVRLKELEIEKEKLKLEKEKFKVENETVVCEYCKATNKKIDKKCSGCGRKL